MSLTLVEASKLSADDPLRSAVIELYARSSDILRTIPFENITGNAIRFNREETLPEVGFRAVNESYNESSGVFNPITEPLVIAGGYLDVDKFIIDTKGEEVRSAHEALQVKALGLTWTKKFIKGNNSSLPREFDGIQVRCTTDQTISAGATVGGAALSLAALDELIDTVEDPMYLIMNKAMKRRLTQAARNTSVGGFISYQQDEFGIPVTMYNDLPILVVDKDETNTDIMAFDEADSTGTTATATSIYCVSFGDGKFVGLQNGGINVADLGELQTQPVYRTKVEWYTGLCLYHTKAVARLRHIGNLAVTV